MADRDFAADDAVARYYARLTEGLPPPVEAPPGFRSFAHLWIAHQRWLRQYYWEPTLVGAYHLPAPTFRWWCQREGILPTPPAPPDPTAPIQLALPGLPPAP